MPKLQNFATPANNDALIGVDVLTDEVGETLSGSTVEWNVFEQQHGVVTNVVPIITKSSASPGGGINILASPPMNFTISLLATDTLGLLGNYYHEALVVDGFGDRDTVMYGVMCVTQSVTP